MAGGKIAQEVTLKNYVFKVVVEPDEFEDGRKAFSARCPELPGAVSYGATEAEALENVKEAIQLVIEEFRSQGRDIPNALAESETAVVVSV